MNLLDTLKALPVPRQIMLAGAVLGVVLAMTVLVRGALEPPMALLYSGLSAEHSGEIIGELEKRGVDYEMRASSIFVPADRRDKVRFELARDGLPKQDVKGYELLDDVNGFSVTSEMYNASYWRAKEGELTRTILAIPGIAAARVHIAASLRSSFSRSQPAHTASVTVSTTRDLTQNQAESIQYLVALAVTGLNPDDVAVIDPNIGILAGPTVDKATAPSSIANDEASSLEAKVLRLLEARLGAGNAQVSVSVDVNRQRQLISDVRFDPDSRVVRQRSINDVTQESAGGGGGALTVASNLPQASAGAAGGTSSVKNSTENVAYEVNETRTETEIMPGEIERISIAVMLSEQSVGLDFSLPGTEEAAAKIIEEFEQLISSAVGLDTVRGDAITVELMPFKALAEPELTPAPSLAANLMDRYFWSALQAGLLGLVVLVLSFGVIRPVLSANRSQRSGSGPTGIDGSHNNGGESGGQDPIEFLKDYASERETETAALLQEWLNEDRKAVVNE